MRKLYSYKLESHPGVNLIEHLKFVGDRCGELVRNKELNFSYSKETIEYIAKIMGYCHDLGKGTIYFQHYLEDAKEYLKNNSNDLKSHAHLSSIFAYYNIKDYDKNLAIIVYICIVSHHGRLKNFEDYMYIENFERKNLLNQYEALSDEVKIICNELNLKYLSKEEFDNTIEEIVEEIDELNDNLDRNKDFSLYILVRYLFSILIYSDKEHAIFRKENNIKYDLPQTLIEDYKLKRFGKSSENNFRDVVYKDVMHNVLKSDNRIMSITLPTGSGKTYTCMSAALQLKHEINKNMKIIYCLPFTSVIDQNYNDYKNAIKEIKKDVKSTDILKHHYLSSSDFIDEQVYYEGEEGRFLTHNWNSQIVVTTFIQLFNSLFSNENSDLIKFNTLSNSIILLDEVQSIPYKYWKIINMLCKEISEILNVYFIFITATQPLIFGKEEINELASQSDYYFKQCKRTKMIYMHNEMDKDEFFQFVEEIVNENIDKNVLIIVNTIKLSQELFKYINDIKEDERELIYLSTSIIPKTRLERIEKIKDKNRKSIVISTQMVEAGVDIDMDIVIRDIAPLDSINQSAGRSNREDRGNYLGEVYIVKIKNNNKLMSKYVYKDDILLQATQNVLKNKDVIYEEEYKNLNEIYFKELNKNKSNSCSDELENYIYELAFEEISKLFKLIEDQNKIQLFIEIDDDATLVWSKYLDYLKIEDKFEKRNKLESIKADFYKYVISIFKNKCKENIENDIGFISKYQLENTYDEDFGYKVKEEASLIF